MATETEEKSPTDENYIHQLPAGIVIAMSSGRPEMLVPFIKSLEDGTVKPTKKMAIEMAKLIQGLIADVVKHKSRVAGLEDDIEHVLEQAQVAQDAAKSIVKTLQEHV